MGVTTLFRRPARRVHSVLAKLKAIGATSASSRKTPLTANAGQRGFPPRSNGQKATTKKNVAKTNPKVRSDERSGLSTRLKSSCVFNIHLKGKARAFQHAPLPVCWKVQLS